MIRILDGKLKLASPPASSAFHIQHHINQPRSTKVMNNLTFVLAAHAAGAGAFVVREREKFLQILRRIRLV